MPRLFIVIPYFNEQATLRDCIERVIKAPLPDGFTPALVLVDDHSSDGSDEIAAAIIDDLNTRGVEVHHHRQAANAGKGAALRAGFDIALEHANDDDLIIIQDADLEYDPADYAGLMQPVIDGEADVVYGSRFGKHYDPGRFWYRIHAFGNAMLTLASNFTTGYRVRDMECCYKLFTTPILRQLRPLMTENRFGVEPQMTAALSRLRARLEEQPVTYDPRGSGAGKKIGWRDAVRAFHVIMREGFKDRRRMLKKIAALLFYIVGIGLLVWYIIYAFSKKTLESGDVIDPLAKVFGADPLLIIVMLACTAGSLLVNGLMFWLTIKPVQDVGLWNMQRVNAIGTAFNYLPLRPGLIMRVAYHMRVDRLGILQIGAWYGAMGIVMLLVLGTCTASILIRQEADWVLAGILLGGLAIGGAATYLIFGHSLIVKHGRGAHLMLRNHRLLWPLIALRLADVVLFSIRVACAAAIVGVPFPNTGIILLLGVTALALRLLPVQLGFREILLGFAATALGSDSVDKSFFALLAVIESAAEAVIVVPAGAISLFWYRRAWARAGSDRKPPPSILADSPVADE